MTNIHFCCPYCHSPKVQDRITEIQCLDCGSIDVLEDSFRVIYNEEPPRPDPMPAHERKVIRIHHVRSNTVLYPRIGQLQNELDEVRGIANYAKAKIQEHTLSSKKKRFNKYD